MDIAVTELNWSTGGGDVNGFQDDRMFCVFFLTERPEKERIVLLIEFTAVPRSIQPSTVKRTEKIAAVYIVELQTIVSTLVDCRAADEAYMVTIGLWVCDDVYRRYKEKTAIRRRYATSQLV